MASFKSKVKKMVVPEEPEDPFLKEKEAEIKARIELVYKKANAKETDL